MDRLNLHNKVEFIDVKITLIYVPLDCEYAHNEDRLTEIMFETWKACFESYEPQIGTEYAVKVANLMVRGFAKHRFGIEANFEVSY